MALRITYQGGRDDGRVRQLESHGGEVRFGRDPARCDVVIGGESGSVLPLHLGLRERADRWLLAPRPGAVVFVNGRPGRAGDPLPAIAEVEFGRGGPRLRVETWSASLQRTWRTTRSLLRGADRETARRALLLAALAILLAFAILAAQHLGWRAEPPAARTACPAEGSPDRRDDVAPGVPVPGGLPSTEPRRA